MADAWENLINSYNQVWDLKGTRILHCARLQIKRNVESDGAEEGISRKFLLIIAFRTEEGNKLQPHPVTLWGDFQNCPSLLLFDVTEEGSWTRTWKTELKDNAWRDRKRKRRGRESFHSLVHSPQMAQWSALGQAEVRRFVPVFHMEKKWSPNTCSIFCFSQVIIRELDQKWQCKNTNQCLYGIWVRLAPICIPFYILNFQRVVISWTMSSSE